MEDCYFVELNDKDEKAKILREALPCCQPQEGSPANTFTHSELEELLLALPSSMKIKPAPENNRKTDFDICHQAWPSEDAVKQDNVSKSSPQDDYYGAPVFSSKQVQLPRSFRESVRKGEWTCPTNAVCPGFLQCNLVVLPAGPIAFDFLLFCQRNPKSCPLIEVIDEGFSPVGVAEGADLRTDVPQYSIYRNGEYCGDVTDATDCWPKQAVAFLIGCSFSYDGELMDAGIPLRSAEAGKNVPMYRTNLKCRSAGQLSGNMVVSMKPIPALSVAKHCQITSKYTHAHGGPVCIGRPDVIGVKDIDKPEWGDAVVMEPTDVPVFHACGVTPQSVLMDSKVPFAITHKAGHMFVTDMPSDMGC